MAIADPIEQMLSALLTTKILIAACVFEAVGLIYALLIPVGDASVWVLLPACLVGIPLILYFGVVAFQPLPQAEPLPSHTVIVDEVEYIPRGSSTND